MELGRFAKQFFLPSQHLSFPLKSPFTFYESTNHALKWMLDAMYTRIACVFNAVK